MKSFGYILSNLRKDNGLSQEKLAEALKIARSTLAMYESDKRYPDKETFERIADYFNCDTDYLHGRQDVKRKVFFSSTGQRYDLVKENEMYYLAGKVLNKMSNTDLDFMIEYNKLSEKHKKALFEYVKQLTKEEDN